MWKAKVKLMQPRIKDNPVAYCYDGDVDRAIKVLRRQVANYGTYGAIRFRRRFPGAGVRRKAKVRRAMKRLERARERGRSW